jgi:hypothetical protein
MGRTFRLACVFTGLLILMESAAFSAAPSDADWLADVRASATLKWVESPGIGPSLPFPVGPGENALRPVPQAGTKPGRPSLMLYLDLRGKAAAQASAYGDLELEPVRGESGQLLNGRGWSLQFGSFLRDDMTPIDRRGGISHWIGPAHPQDGICIPIIIKSPPPARSIVDLRGSVALQTGGRYETIVVSDKLMDSRRQIKEETKSDTKTGIGISSAKFIFGHGPSTEHIERQVNSETLKRLGITVELAYQERKAEPPITRTVDGVTEVTVFAGPAHELSIDARWGETLVTRFEVADASGKPIKETSSGGSRSENQWSVTLGYPNKLPDDAQLRVTVHRDYQIVRVPFALKDLKIPPAPPMPEGLPQPIGVPQPIDLRR